jgi:hypothetical protein
LANGARSPAPFALPPSRFRIFQAAVEGLHIDAAGVDNGRTGNWRTTQ